MIRTYLCLFVLHVAMLAVNGQEDQSEQLLFNQIFSAIEKEYGVDQELINGVLYEKKNQDAIGHPYFLDYHLHQGRLIYRGKQYSNLTLQYDIYDQKVLLTYLFDTLEYKLYLHNEFISEFTIEDKKFVNQEFRADEASRFYQVIGEEGSCKIIYYWKKGLTKLDRKVTGRKNIFSAEEKNSFLLLRNSLIEYKGNRSFAKNFTSNRKADIKAFLRKQRINVRNAGDDEMKSLIGFINTLDISGNKDANGDE